MTANKQGTGRQAKLNASIEVAGFAPGDRNIWDRRSGRCKERHLPPFLSSQRPNGPAMPRRRRIMLWPPKGGRPLASKSHTRRQDSQEAWAAKAAEKETLDEEVQRRRRLNLNLHERTPRNKRPSSRPETLSMDAQGSGPYQGPQYVKKHLFPLCVCDILPLGENKIRRDRRLPLRPPILGDLA